MIRQNDEVPQWFTGRGRRRSGSAPHRTRLAPLVESLEERALLATIAAPSNLAGTALGPDHVALTWTESSAVSDFEIEWSSNGGRSYTAPVTSTTTSYTATGLSSWTSYLFRVRADNSVTHSSWAGPLTVTTAYTTGFDTAPTSPPWTYTPTSDWSYNAGEGVLQQTGNEDADPRKAILSGLSGTPNDIYARVRFDSIAIGEFNRAGVGLYTNPTTGRGLNLVVTSRWYNIDTTNHPFHLEFLNDGVGWSGWLVNGKQTTVAIATPQVNTWYWFHMTVSGGKLYGNFWMDPNQNPGASSPTGEPPGWMVVYNPADQGVQYQWNLRSGVAALTGSSTGTFPGAAPSGGAVSFDDVTVRTGVTASAAFITTASASASTSAMPLAPLVAPGAGAMDDPTLTDLASELIRSQRKR
jgi:hypothetical protein